MRARVFVSSAVAVAVWVSAVGAQSGADADPVQLPARRVILYKSGVGYFEHVGNVNGSREVAIQFTSGQLNDVLKSLTALDLDNGQISAINYNSVAPLDQRLRALRMPLGSRADALQFYNALRGARVDVRSPAGPIDGRLLGVERKTRTVDGRAEEVDTLTVVAASGAVRSVVMGPEVTIRIGEQDLRDEISRYLAVVASGRDADVRRMVLNASGTGTRRLFVSYISEVPIWKSTYRLVLPETPKDKPRLQGWAIVDNTIGEDWTNVQLSLVAGAPQSFIQEISQPYYSRRPVVALPQTVVLGPQTHAAPIQVGTGTVRGVVRDASGAVLPGATVRLLDSGNRTEATAISDANGAFAVAAPVGTHRVTVEIPGFMTHAQAVSVSLGATTQMDAVLRLGALQQTVTVQAATPRGARSGGRAGAPFLDAQTATGPTSPILSAPVVTQSERAAGFHLAASAQDLGDLFEYRLDQPVTIRKDQSALVPIVNADIEAERVSLWNRPQGSGRPLRALWLHNSTALTLDGGTFSVVDARAFAGEGIVEPLKPGEKRLLSYGTDLAVQVDARNTTEAGRYVRVTARGGVMLAETESRSQWTYRVRNEDTTPRTLIIEHPRRDGWSIATDGPRPDETTPSAMRFWLQVGARSEASLVVPERHVGHVEVSVGDVDDDQLQLYEEGGLDAEAIRRAMRPIRDKQAQIRASEERAEELMQQEHTLVSDQARLRENMKALRGSVEERALTLRYTRQLGTLEDRLAALREDLQATRKASLAQEAELEALVLEWEFELLAR
jgi:hypothetical protein